MEIKENMDFVMTKDPTLEPSKLYRAILLEYTDKCEVDLNNEVMAAVETMKTESHYRFVCNYKYLYILNLFLMKLIWETYSRN